jgi:hypothetical protein
MADRALVLSAPAKVALEVRIDDAARGNERQRAILHDQIAAAMHIDPRTEPELWMQEKTDSFRGE